MTTKKTKKTKAPASTKMPPGVGAIAKAKAQVLAEAKEAQAALIALYEDVENPKPHLECRIFPLPSYCSVSSVAMRELDGEDDIMSAYWADQNAGEATKQSHSAAMIADQREGIRIALVGVEGRQVNDDGSPFMACDEWTSKTWRFLMQAFSELNGVSHDDLKNAVRGSLAIGMSPSASGASQGAGPGEE